jgi:hypothetical protein
MRILSTRSAFVVVASLLSFVWSPEPAVDVISLGIAECEVVWAAKTPGRGQDPAFGVIVRIYSEDQRRESFALSDKRGLAFVPLRPGKYCLQAFDDKGSELGLDPTQAKCFSIEKNGSPIIGVVLSWQEHDGDSRLIR